ncbi:hypothetical protein AMIS_79400 [Actinoplanes missouriensis 431]|uniref:Uncharacterized protein n=1 Tax=Actinoplanes missouriensis (strain ATCC 14538 / DSM 43046 / CBS 188.64 / JCM 3121 / NBRC 102363 / NCIMB 12654 / NRRL B-3342 / UNCC 431) TaxID=512565 RepID=I0HJH3_ACTM4|nr:hypothetical protein AMIS_79400 [Actinoplanes missouriensis 431]
MNDLNRLAVLDPARGTEPTEMQWARSRAAVERIMSGQGSGAVRRSPARRWITIGAVAVAAGLAAVVAVPILVPGAAEKAVASWTAMPTSRTGDQVMTQAEICGSGEVGGSSATVRPSDVILAEQRGDATLLIMRKTSGDVVECLIVGKDQVASMGLTAGKPLPAPPAGTVNLETMSSAGEGDGMWSNVVGLAAPDVTAVEIRLDNGRTFQASVRGGWWGAWWPGPEGGEGTDTFTIIVHSGAGTTEHRPSELP